MPRQKRAAVLDSRLTLGSGFEKIAHYAEDSEHCGDQKVTPPCLPPEDAKEGGIRQRAGGSAGRPFPRLAGADGRRELVAAERASDEIGRRVGDPHEDQDGQDLARLEEREREPSRHHDHEGGDSERRAVSFAYAAPQPKRDRENPEERRKQERRQASVDIENPERTGRRRGVDPRRRSLEVAQARPFEGTGSDEKRDEERECRPRQEEERGEKADEERRRRGDADCDRAFQAAPARLLADDAACTCSLVRPKRRSRLR